MKVTFLDAAETVWRQDQIKHVMSTIYEFEYSEVRARELFPPDFEPNEGAGTVSYEIMDRFGVFKIISSSTSEIPDIDVYIREYEFPVKLLAGKYSITNEDFRRARMSGRNVSTMRAKAARQAHLEAENALAWFGSAKHGIQGILNHPRTIEVALPPDGTGSSYDWADKISDPAKILRDLSLIASASPTLTNEIEVPDTLLLASRRWRFIKDVPFGTNADKTLLDYFLKANPNIKNIVPIPELNGAGIDGSDLALCYKRSSDKLVLSIPMEFQPSQEVPVALKVEIPNEAKTAGVILIKPLSVAYARISKPNAGRTIGVHPDYIPPSAPASDVVVEDDEDKDETNNSNNPVGS